jgi:dTDP-4-amino-4,6-dideoxygalactose transaminase
VLESGWSGQGPRCAELEKQWKEMTGAQNAHFVSSATAALHLAVRLQDLPKGSVVATTPLTFVSTNAAILYEGLVPLFCDCNDDLSLKFDSVKEAVESKGATVVMWVHHGGNVSPDFYMLMDYVKEHGHVRVIEDCAHASGAFYADGSRVGSRTDTISCFSFHSVKNLPIFDGGMLCCPTEGMDTRARRLSWMGIDKSTYARTAGSGNEVYKWSYDVPELGWKYNGNDVAAAIGLVQIRYLDRDNAYRRLLYERYADRLVSSKSAMLIGHERGSSHHLVMAMVENREQAIASLKANGVAPGVHYLPNYLFPVFQGFDHSLCVNVEDVAGEILSLPNHLCMSVRDVDEVCRLLEG